jgi:hypothetical protein
MATEQLSLLGWTEPQAEMAFDERDVRGASVAARTARAVSVALRDCGRSRRQVAQQMSEYLGEDVSPAMIDAYASVAREAHRISLPRFLALLHVTGDRRLLQMLAQPMGWAVIERKHLVLIELAAAREQEDALRRRREALARRARTEGAL